MENLRDACARPETRCFHLLTSPVNPSHDGRIGPGLDSNHNDYDDHGNEYLATGIAAGGRLPREHEGRFVCVRQV